MKPYELARLIQAYYASTTEPTVLGFAEWLQKLDTTDNQYRYGNTNNIKRSGRCLWCGGMLSGYTTGHSGYHDRCLKAKALTKGAV